MDSLINSGQAQKTQDDSVNQQVPVQPTPVGSVHKEQGPAAPVVQTSEFIKPSDSEPQITKELSEIGVEAVSHTPALTKEHQDAGVYHAKESVPVATEPAGIVALPMTQTQAVSILKMHKKVSESILWLATLILKQFKLLKS